ncbi:MAG: hypothetical protein NTZ84_03420 [Candidatus Nealsonbacteria bacterium]|nr:hypothetical protein [Candidatus Nealsonbacteria bacterium]
MDFILAILKKYEISLINDAYDMYLDLKGDNEKRGKAVQSPPKLFNWCVKTTIQSDSAVKEERRTFNDDSIGRE